MADIATSPASPSSTFYGSGRVRAAVDGSVATVSIRSRVGILSEVLAGLTYPLGDRVRRGLPESSMCLHSFSRPAARDSMPTVTG